MKNQILIILFILIRHFQQLSYEFLPKIKNSLLNSEKCTVTTNNYYIIWLCEDKIAFIPNENYHNNSKIQFYIGKFSLIYTLGKYIYLLDPLDHKITILILDDLNVFEQFYLDLSDLFFTNNRMQYQRIHAIKNGDFVTFCLVVKESDNTEAIVFFSIVDYYPAFKRNKNLIFYNRQIIYIGFEIKGIFLFQNRRSGFLNLLLALKDKIQLYETCFEVLSFKWKSNLLSENEINQVIFFENLVLLQSKQARNQLILLKYQDNKEKFVQVCELLIEEKGVISHITISKGLKLEYSMSFIDKLNKKLYIYTIYLFEQFYLKDFCYLYQQETNEIFENLLYINYFEVRPINKTEIFRYLLFQTLFLDNNEVFGLIPFCYTNELYIKDLGCIPCGSMSFSNVFQGNYCEYKCENLITNQNNHSLAYSILFHCSLPNTNCENLMEPYIISSFSNKTLKWTANNSLICSLDCIDQSLSLIDDQCVDSNTKILFLDYCRKFSDCYDCSIAYDCLWCNGICRNIAQQTSCHLQIEFKTADNLWKFDKCNRKPFCGKNKTFLEAEGQISLQFSNNNSLDLIPKNSICSWEIFSYKGLNSDNVYFNILMVMESGFVQNFNTTMPRISYCLFSFHEPYCYTWAFEMNSTNFTMRSKVFFKRFRIVLYFPEETVVDSKKFIIKFQKKQEYLLDFTDMFGEWILMSILSILFMICCILLLKIAGNSIRRNSQNAFFRMRGLEIELFNFESPNRRMKRFLKEKIIVKQTFESNNNNIFSQEECPFCLEKFVSADQLAKCYCKHIFHFSCIEQWNQIESKSVLQCPLCKKNLEKSLVDLTDFESN